MFLSKLAVWVKLRTELRAHVAFVGLSFTVIITFSFIKNTNQHRLQFNNETAKQTGKKNCMHSKKYQ